MSDLSRNVLLCWMLGYAEYDQVAMEEESNYESAVAALNAFEKSILNRAEARVKAAKERRDAEFYPYFPESYEAETDGWESALKAMRKEES